MSEGLKIKKSRNIDMNSGSILANIIKFILPLMATNLLIELYQAADIMIVGWSTEPDAIGATGSAASLLSLVTTLYLGFSVGATVLVSRSIGEGDEKKLTRAIHTAVAIAVISGIGGGIIGVIISHPVISLLGYTGRILELGTVYASIRFAFMPFAALQKFLTAILNAYGDTRTSLYILSFTGILNVLLNTFFVLVVGLSVEGVAIATGMANIAASTLLWRRLASKHNPCPLSARKVKIHKAELIDIIRIGLPSGLQSAMFSISNLIITSSIVTVNNALTPVGSAYEPILKGHTAAGSIETTMLTALAALTTTSTTFTSRLVGAKNYKRVRRSFGTICAVALTLVFVISGACILLRDPLLSLYDVSSSATDTLSVLAYDTALTRIFIKWTTLFPFVIMNVCTGAIRGLGKSSLAAIITFVGTCLLRVVWIYTIFEHFETLESIYLSYPASWILTGGISLIVYLVVEKKKEREYEEKKL